MTTVLRRIPIRLFLIFLPLSASGFRQGPPIQSPNDGRRQDTYAIYSAVISNEFQPSDPEYFIDETTWTSRTGFFGPYLFATPPPYFQFGLDDIVNDTKTQCVQVPTDRQASLREVLDEYDQQRQDSPTTLAREFTLAKPYRLFNAVETRTFLSGHAASGEYSKSSRVIGLGNVYFNRNRTVAFTYVSVSSRTSGGRGKWVAFEKSAAGNWEQRTWVGCEGKWID